MAIGLSTACREGHVTEAVAGPAPPAQPHAQPHASSPAAPRVDEHRALLGSFVGMSDAERRAFGTFAAFAPLPAPAPGDWLDIHAEEGQTVPQYASSLPNVPAIPRNKIYLLPIGPLPAERGPTVEELSAHAIAFFGLPVEILPAIDPGALEITRRVHDGHPQLNAAELLDHLETTVPDDAYCVAALTLEDLYPDESFNYVFGLARLRARVGVFSFARYHPSFFEPGQTIERTTLVRRAFKVMSHEIGHMFGMAHCTFFACNMNGSNHLDELDREPSHLCPVCLRKLHMAVHFDPIARYRALGAVYERHGLAEEARWTSDRIATIDDR